MEAPETGELLGNEAGACGKATPSPDGASCEADAMLTLDETTHTYRDGDTIYPSVTQIVRAVVAARWSVDDWYLDRGKMIHRCMAFVARGSLIDPATLDERIRGFVKAGQDALWHLAETPVLIEHMQAHPVMGYAGTLDLLTHEGSLVDYKSGAADLSVVPQLGGYALLCEQHQLKVKKCLSIELHEDGTYRMDTLKPWRCIGLFKALFSVYGWMKAEGMLDGAQ